MAALSSTFSSFSKLSFSNHSLKPSTPSTSTLRCCCIPTISVASSSSSSSSSSCYRSFSRNRGRLLVCSLSVSAYITEPKPIDFKTSSFRKEKISINGHVENIVRGGRDQFSVLGNALKGIKQVGVIGSSHQAFAQAQNLRDSLAEGNVPIKIKIATREDPKFLDMAYYAGFTKENETLGDMFEIVSNSDLLLLFMEDLDQVDVYSKLISRMKPGSILGLSDGLLFGYLQSNGVKFRQDISVIGVFPKGNISEMRCWYVQAKEEEINTYAGINSSFVVYQDNIYGRATDVAIGLSIGIGSPFTFATTPENKYKSSMFGAQGVLFSAFQGTMEALFERHIGRGESDEIAYKKTVECITGNFSKTISTKGMLGLYDSLSESEERALTEAAYRLSYNSFKSTFEECYEEVTTGYEIGSIVQTWHRLSIQEKEDYLQGFPMANGQKRIWQVGEQIRKARPEGDLGPLCPHTAGVYMALMMAHIDVMRAKGHSYFDIITQSVLELVDHVNPTIHAHGVKNFSTIAARLGSRKWVPMFYYAAAHPDTTSDTSVLNDRDLIGDFISNPVHRAFEDYCSQLRANPGYIIIDKCSMRQPFPFPKLFFRYWWGL